MVPRRHNETRKNGERSLHLHSDDTLGKIIDGIEVIDLLYDFPADFKSGQDFLGLIRKLQPRLYSIASSPKKHPGEVHLAVAKVVYEAKDRVQKGVASNFLCDCMSESETVRVFLEERKVTNYFYKDELEAL